MNYDPFGRGGAGAPHIGTDGNPITKLSGVAKFNEDFEVNTS